LKVKKIKLLIAREVYAVDAGRLNCSWRLQELNMLLELRVLSPTDDREESTRDSVVSSSEQRTG